VSLPQQDFSPGFGWYEDGRFEVPTFNGRVLMHDILETAGC
jgi:hypothetical protein